jgi:hypothetical protein
VRDWRTTYAVRKDDNVTDVANAELQQRQLSRCHAWDAERAQVVARFTRLSFHTPASAAARC